jgi:hypothetical protein
VTIEPISTADENPNRLTLDDFADQRAYERERPAFRARMLEVRKRRRLTLGPIVAVSFESRDTIRYQIQEMARAEKLSTDEDIQIELDTYNPLVPGPGQLCATVFLELTDDDQMRQWLPKLVGIEQSIVIDLADGTRICSIPEAQHATQLTRENATSAVHYVQFEITPVQRAVLLAGPVVVGVDHPEYRYEVTVSHETALELAADS